MVVACTCFNCLRSEATYAATMQAATGIFIRTIGQRASGCVCQAVPSWAAARQRATSSGMRELSVPPVTAQGPLREIIASRFVKVLPAVALAQAGASIWECGHSFAEVTPPPRR
jgi:hypothetical protein